MTTVYILCKEDRYGDNIESIIKVFNNHTKALKELYEYSWLYNEHDQNIKFNRTFFILTKNIDDDSGIDENYEHVYNFVYINKYITKDIWQKVINELPKKKTLNKLITYEIQMREYLKQRKNISNELIENKTDITKEINDKLNELNILMPELKLD
jgi:hypothetical protein